MANLKWSHFFPPTFTGTECQHIRLVLVIQHIFICADTALSDDCPCAQPS